MHLLEAVVARRTLAVLALSIGALFLVPRSQPERSHVVVTDTETTILDVVEFEPATATLREASKPTLDAVAATLLGNPSITLVEVQSHTSGIGDSAGNLALSAQRAQVIVQYLVDAGVAPSRLVAEGYGDTEPLDRAAPAKNERISFVILKRSDSAANP